MSLQRALVTALLGGTGALWSGASLALEKPFSQELGPPGVVSVGVHSGSYHRDGLGLALGVHLLPWLQIEGSGAYRYEISLATALRGILFPSASLSPYATLGFDRSVTRLKNELRYTSYSAFLGLGLQARIARDWFLAVEGAALYTTSDEARVGDAIYKLTPADRLDVVPGGRFGFYFF